MCVTIETRSASVASNLGYIHYFEEKEVSAPKIEKDEPFGHESVNSSS